MGKIVLQVSKLCKSFGNLKVVDGVSFEIAQGEILGFLGPNGAGKTTSISLITGNLSRDSGDIRYYGQSMEKCGSIVKRVGLCTQHLQLWPLMTCWEQMMVMGKLQGMSAADIKNRANHLLECMKLTEKKNVLARKLSGGMQRRLHIIMSIIHDPDIIILDEPEAGLDPQSRILVRDYIMSLKDSKAVLLTTHNMDEAERLSSRIAIMDKGKMLELDTAEKLKKKLAPEDKIEIIFDKNADLRKVSLDSKYKVSVNRDTLIVSGSDVVLDIPAIFEKVSRQVGKPQGFNLRQSTLEDVFINLTGRSLRE